MPFYLAGHHTVFLCLYLRLRADLARLVSDPRLPVQQRPLDRDRRDARGNLAGARPRSVRHRAIGGVLRATLWPLPRRAPIAEQRRAPAWLSVAELSPGNLQALAPR